jgi:release factor glutamine methyltransferase
VNLKQALSYARGVLEEHNIEDAPLEGEVLLRHVLGISRSRLFSDLDDELNPVLEENLNHLIERRCYGEPSAYITGHREFFGLGFCVDRRVLIPRPESELIVEKAIAIAREGSIATVADIGTGCGAIAVSLAVNLPAVSIYATDISAEALEVARVNCLKHNVLDRIRLLQGDMLEPLPGAVDLIIANLPYVSESELRRDTSLSYEPALALNGGRDGMEKIENLCRQAAAKLYPAGCLLLEIGKGQGKVVVSLLREMFPSARIEVSPDFGGIERVVSLCLTKG